MALEHRSFLEGGGLQFFVAKKAATASVVRIVKNYSPNLSQPMQPVEWLAAWVSADEPSFLQLVTKNSVHWQTSAPSRKSLCSGAPGKDDLRSGREEKLLLWKLL